MSDIDLDAIEQAIASDPDRTLTMGACDVEVLVAEVRRLQADNNGLLDLARQQNTTNERLNDECDHRMARVAVLEAALDSVLRRRQCCDECYDLGKPMPDHQDERARSLLDGDSKETPDA